MRKIENSTAALSMPNIQSIRIGKWCTIGAGTVIIRDIPDYATAVGNPARVIKMREAPVFS